MRPMATDPFHNSQFAVVIGGNIQLRAKTVSQGEFSAAPVTYRTGDRLYTEKYPGVPEFGDVTIEDAVIRAESPLLQLFYASIGAGPAEYRFDAQLYHFHRVDLRTVNRVTGIIDAAPSRIIAWRDAFVSTTKPAPDMDADNRDVSIRSTTITVEKYKVMYVDTTIGA